MKIIKSTFARLVLIVAIILQSGCGGGDGTENPPIDETKTPGKAVGTLPANGEACADYEEVTNDDTKVLVLFSWNAAQFAQSYILVVSEGSNEVFRNSLNSLNTEVQLDRGKTYTWLLTSVNSDKETIGDTFSFTTPGIPVGNFAPYAAEIAIEFDINTLEMSVSWIGSDEEDDQLSYDITVWENESILMEEVDYIFESIDPITFTSGENYIVEIVSKDSSGNFSISVASEKAPE